MRMTSSLIALAVASTLVGCSKPSPELVHQAFMKEFNDCPHIEVDVTKTNGMRTENNGYKMGVNIAVSGLIPGVTQVDIDARHQRLDEIKNTLDDLEVRTRAVFANTRIDLSTPSNPLWLRPEQNREWNEIQKIKDPLVEEQIVLQAKFAKQFNALCSVDYGDFMRIYYHALGSYNSFPERRQYAPEQYATGAQIHFNAVVEFIDTENGWMIKNVASGLLTDSN